MTRGIRRGVPSDFLSLRDVEGVRVLGISSTLGAWQVADNTTRIAEIREILRSGVSSFSNDGTSVSHDFAALRRELRELIAEDDTEAGRRPSSFNVDLSGF